MFGIDFSPGADMITGLATAAVSQPVKLVWIIGIVFVLFIFIFVIRQFFDIIVDIWKLPFAILVDAIDTLAYNNPYLDVAACLGNLILFWALAKRGDHQGKLFGLIAAAEALIGIWILPQFAGITNLLPLTTILMALTVWSS